MPRTGRLDAPGALHHVMARGIERREIFRDDGDRAAFADLRPFCPRPFATVVAVRRCSSLET